MKSSHTNEPDIRPGKGGGDEETVYMNKKSEFQLLKTDLEERQSTIMGVYSYLLELHEKMVGAGREVERLEPALQLLDLSGAGWRNSNLPPVPDGERHELSKRISDLAAQMTGVCHEVLTSRNAIIDCLKVMGTTNEMGETNLASKIREWGAEGEALCMLVGTTARKTDTDALSISNRVSELVQQVAANSRIKEDQLQLKTEVGLDPANKRKQMTGILNKSRTSPTKQQPCSLTKPSHQLVNYGQRRVEIGGCYGNEDARKRQHEQEVRTYRMRIRDLEHELKDLKAGYVEQTKILQSLESEVKQRESQHESRLRILRDHVRTAEQKMQAVTEERNKLLQSSANAQKDGEIICSLKDRNTKLANALEELGEEENMTKKNNAELTKECTRLKNELISAERDLRDLKQENCKYMQERTILLESKEKSDDEMKLIKLTFNQELSELKDELFNVCQERDRYLQIEPKMNENEDTRGQEQQLHEAHTFIAAKVEEVRKLHDLVSSKHQHNEILADQIKAMEEHLNKSQRRRVQYEKKITTLESEVQSLKDARKGVFGFF